MNREELILSCKSWVENLVKKYNDYKLDEDLVSVGMVAVVECVDRCLEEEMTDTERIQARCGVWARNRILDEIYKEKIKYADDDFILDNLEAPEDDTLYIVSIRQQLTPRQLEIFDLLYAGDTHEEVCEKLNITQPTLYEHLRNIKTIIKSEP